MRSRRFYALLLVVTLVLAACGGGGGGGGADPTTVTGDLGFRPEPNGFHFPNFGGASRPSQLTAAEIFRLFGDPVCASKEGDECKLLPCGKEWMRMVNKAMKGGRCEGFAVLSQLIFSGQASAADFGGTSAYDLDIGDNDALNRELAYWYATQFLEDVMARATQELNAKEAVAFLGTEFVRGDETYRVGIVKIGPTGSPAGGHAMTAYAVADGDAPGQKRILVYDNNHPGQERAIEVDLDANRWEYSAAVNPDAPEGLYFGDAGNGNRMYITATTPRLGTQVCPFCEQGAAGKPDGPFGAAPRSRTLLALGDAEVTVTDPYGYRLGYVDGKPIAELPGSRVLFAFGADDGLWNDDAPPIYFVPPSSDLETQVMGVEGQEDEEARIGIFGEGFSLAVDDIPLEPGQADTVGFSGDGTSVTYDTETPGGGKVTLAAETDEGGVLISVETDAPDGGHAITVGIDEESGDLTIEVESEEPVEVHIEMTVAG